MLQGTIEREGEGGKDIGESVDILIGPVMGRRGGQKSRYLPVPPTGLLYILAPPIIE